MSAIHPGNMYLVAKHLDLETSTADLPIESWVTYEQAVHARDILNAHETANGRPETYYVTLNF